MALLFLGFFFSVITSSRSEFKPLDAVKVRSAIVLPGRVLTNEDSFQLLQREAKVVFEKNLPQYLKELRKTNARKDVDFTEKDFAVVGSLATLDALITFGEGVANVNVVRKDRRAGFSGYPNPTNDKLHAAVVRLNAARNIVWLIKEKLKNGVVKSDAPLLDKLKEAQTWLSTQTGGHLGEGMEFALKKAGITAYLKKKWGGKSLKFKSFSAGVGNGLDFLVNSYNTVVNSLALNEEISVPNILALTSSITAMAGDVTIGIAQVLSKGFTLAGPIGFALGATLYIASYSASVAQGIANEKELEPKDYVKIFLSPLIPDPTFGAKVDVIDEIVKGNHLEAYYLQLQHFTFLPPSFAITAKLISHFIPEYLEYMENFRKLIENNRLSKFYKQVATKIAGTVRQLKPKKVTFVYPHMKRRDHYMVEGWKSDEAVKRNFQISAELSPVHLFLATYSNQFARPFKCQDKAEEGFTFCPDEAPHGDDKLIFVGSQSVNDKVILDDNCEAYGMDGNDHFVLKAAAVRKGVGINGGNGRDTIDITNTFYGSRSFVTGGGPEKDVIKTGPGDDTIIVNNDDVEITNGDNTLLVEGKGSDDIRLGSGADLVIVEKTGGNICVGRVDRSNELAEYNKPKRIVYKGYGRIKDSDKNDFIRGGPTQFDLLRMTQYSPNFQKQRDERILLIEPKTTIDKYLDQIGQVQNGLFKDHEFEISRRNGAMRSEAQRIEFISIERFELSENATNMLLLKNGRSDYYEITGGSKHDFVINLDGSTPLLAQLGTGDNRILSGRGKDNYSVILDGGDDIIYDKGGDNILVVQLQQGKALNDATISRSSNNFGYKIECKARPRDYRIEFIFLRGIDEHGGLNGGSVRIIVGDSTGKQITFKPVARPSEADNNHFSEERSVGSYYYERFEYCPGDQDVLMVEGIAPAIGKTLPRPHCHHFKNSVLTK